jgi:uncharacterized protein
MTNWEPAMVQDERGRGPTLATLREKRQEIIRVAEARGARNVRVFGSVARDEARETSDVDFLVDMEMGRSALDLSELILDLEEILGRRVDEFTTRRPTPLAANIVREAVPL